MSNISENVISEENCELTNNHSEKSFIEDENSSNDEYEELLVFLGFPDYDDNILFKDDTVIEIIGAETSNPECKVYSGFIKRLYFFICS